MTKPKFLEKVKRVHLTGIKGVGMTAIALCFQDLSLKITGSDTEEIFVTDEILEKRKISWQIGFSEKNLNPKPDLVITTGAHGGLENPEVLAARKLGIPVLTHAQALGKLADQKETISVCGVGGKTTTSALIATILKRANLKPSFAIGSGMIKPLIWPGCYDQGQQFIAEADEYANSPMTDLRPRFSFQNPKIVVVTNIEHDHPDIYQDLSATKKVFADFFQKIPQAGLLVACFDNENTMSVSRGFNGNCQTYGFSPGADWQIDKVLPKDGQTTFSLVNQNLVIEGLKINVPGNFNVLNAAAAFVVANFLGVNAEAIKSGLLEFGGVKRRFEFIGKNLYDDYAHHPQEIEATLKAAKSWFAKRRLVVIFQPHTYSRTRALFAGFSRAFGLANLVVVVPIYASAREKDNLNINSQLLVEEIKKHQPNAFYQPDKNKTIEFLKNKIRPDDIIFTMGAGDIFLWHQDILNSLTS